ncbi:MAG: arsenate reductase ArsC [Bacteroidetes bacterium]|nr:arsenate reductase ArsC [Bacteroidota bacterium]
MDANNSTNGFSSCHIEGFKYKEPLYASEKKFERKRILIICTGNSCRSQMAEGWLRLFDERLDVFSAGTRPEKEINHYAVKAMEEVGVDISLQFPKFVNHFIKDDFNYVITVCDNARQVCPVFTGNVKHHLHIGFEDPADAKGSSEEIMETYRKVRDQMRDAFYKFILEME